MSEPPEGVQSGKRRTCRGTRGVSSLETWIALITRPADQLLSATSMPVAVMTDRGKKSSSVRFAALVGRRACLSLVGLWTQPVLNRQMDARAGQEKPC